MNRAGNAAECGAPLSYTQESLWLLEQISQSDEPVYNESLAFQISGVPHTDLLCEALRRVVERHGSLRTAFVETPDGLRAVVHEDAADFIEITDLRYLDAKTAAGHAEELVNDSYRRRFNLASGRLIRAVIVLLANEAIFGITVHHIAADGWSLSIILDEIHENYVSLSQFGHPAELPELASQYGAFVSTVRKAHERGAFGEQIDYWIRTLSDAPKLLKLPVDRPRPPSQTFRGATHSLIMPKSRVSALTERCREYGGTEFTVLLSVYAALLHRYTGQDKITVATTLLNRSDVDHLNVVGCFVNTAALVFQFEEGMTFRRLLTDAVESSIEMLQHQDAPYPKVLDALHVERDPSHNPVFQTMFTSLGKRKVLDLGEGITCRPFPVRRVAAKFEVLLYVSEFDDSIEFEIEFNVDLFDAVTIERMLNHYVCILERLADDIDVPVARITCLPDEDKKLILNVWNNTKVNYPDSTVIDMFEAQTVKTPDAVAVEVGDQSLTYDELNRLSNRVAHYLLARSSPHMGYIGVYMERSLDMVIALVSIVKAGLAYVPIDPEYPIDRIHYMIEDSNVPVILTQQRHRAALSDADAEIVVLSDLAQRTGGDGNVVRALSFDSRIYMIYTSGSTGRPKGVINRHGSLFNRLYWMQCQYALTGDDRVLQKTPFSFDVSVWEFFWPLMVGARIVIAEPGGHRDTGYLKTVIRDKQITTLHFVPSMLNVFLEEEELAAHCGSVRQVFCSGEALPRSMVENFYANLSCELHNLYGPTEAAIDVSYWPCSLDYPGRIVPIGTPIANTTLYVLDKDLHLQPIGVSGELCIGGVGLAEGYHNRSDLTRRAFVPDPFTDAPGARLYKTGDLARYLPDGQIQYLGRIDNQVKLRGFRVELGEIESVVRSLPDVKDAAVVVHETSNNRMLVAYIVADRFDPQGTKEQLHKQLPDFMIPQLLIELSAIPTTANGKLDRKALPDPFTEQQLELDGAVQTPASTDEERTLLAIWRNVLGIRHIGVDSNFFRLGGDSILSIRIAARVREAGYAVELQQIFAYPTIQELARHLTPARREPANVSADPFWLVGSSDRPFLGADIEDAWPLTTLQAGMLYHSMTQENSSIYHDVFAYDVEALFNRDYLFEAVRKVTAGHPQLRSAFDLAGFSEPFQVVRAEAEVPLRITDLTSLPWPDQDVTIDHWIDTERCNDFDLEHGPLVRIQVHVRSTSLFNLAISFHHSILDGWSIALVIKEICRIYSDLLAGRPGIERPEHVPYSVYVNLEREASRDTTQADFWLDCLADLPPVSLAVTKENIRQTASPASAERTIPESVVARLQALSDDLGTPAKSVFLALHLHVLGRLADQKTIMSGLVVNGRPEVRGGEELAGLFLNIVPFPIVLPPEDWPSLISRIFTLERAIIAHRRFPLAEILKRSGHKSLFETIFNYTDFHLYRAEDDQTIRIVSARYFEQTNFGVVVHAHRDNFSGRMQIVVNHDPATRDSAWVDRYLDYYLDAVAAIAENADMPRWPGVNDDQEHLVPQPLSVGQRPQRVAYAAPRNPLEVRITEIIAQAASVDQVGIDDNYLELGVDSITAIRVVAKMKRLGVGLAIQDIFEHSTIKDLATHIGAEWTPPARLTPVRSFELAGVDPRVFPAGVVDAYPATSMQLYMIRRHDLDVDQATYHDIFAYYLALPLEQALLETTLERLVNGHETLRTAFAMDAQPVPMQLVYGAVAPRLGVFDLSSLPETDQETVFGEWFEQEKRHGFDWSKPGLVRFYAHRRSTTAFTLTVSFHHSVIDGWSLSLFIQELISLYTTALRSGVIPELEVPTVKYRDYVRVEHDIQHRPEFREFWQAELRDFTYNSLPTLGEYAPESRWSEAKLTLHPAKQQSLTALSHRLSVPLKHTMLAAHLAVIGLACQETEVLTGVFTSCRLEEEDGDDALGLFLNFMPFRQSIGEHTWRTFVKQTLMNDRRLLPYRRYSLASIEQDLGRDRTVKTAFNYTQFKSYGNLAYTPEGGPGNVLTNIQWFEHTHFALLANVGYDLRQESMIITLNADGKVLRQRDVEVLANLYDAVLTQMVEHEQAKVIDVSDDTDKLTASLVGSPDWRKGKQ